jgi:hypothetical protein
VVLSQAEWAIHNQAAWVALKTWAAHKVVLNAVPAVWVTKAKVQVAEWVVMMTCQDKV